MTPYEEMQEVYRTEPCARSFAEDLELHHLNGYVYSTPHFFVMARPVWSEGPRVAIVHPAVDFRKVGVPLDCWHVYGMAGDMRRAWEIMPYPLPLISFERKNELRFHSLAAIRRLSALYQ